MSKLKMVKLVCSSYGVWIIAYVNPMDVSSVVIQYEDFVQAKSKVKMRDGSVYYSGKEPAELVAEIEAAANE